MINLEKENKEDFLNVAKEHDPGLFNFLKASAEESFYKDTSVGLLDIESDIKQAESVAYGDTRYVTGHTIKDSMPIYGMKKELYNDEDEWKSSENYREGLKFNPEWSKAEAQVRAKHYDKNIARNKIIERGDNGATRTVLGFGASVVTQFIAPENYLPLGSVAKGGKFAAQAGKAFLMSGAENLAISGVTRSYWERNFNELSSWQDYAMDTIIGGAFGALSYSGGRALEEYSTKKAKLTIAEKKQMAESLEKTLVDIEEGRIPEPPELPNLESIEDIAKSDHGIYLSKKLQEAGLDEIEAADTLAPVFAHAETFSKYYGIDPEDYLKNNILKDVNVEGENVLKFDSKNKPIIDEEIQSLIDVEVEAMLSEVMEATPGKRSGVQIVNPKDGEGYLKNINTSTQSDFPKWYRDIGVKNKDDLKKVVESKKGKRYQRLLEVAKDRLENGYESKINGRIEPDNYYRQLLGLDEINVDNARFSSPELEEVFYQSKDSTLKDSSPKGVRGSVSLSNKVVNLFEKADRSTFLHESGHLFLESLKDISKLDNAPEFAKKDWGIIKEWLGVKGDKLSREQHEKFARGFEQYLREGNAPNKTLKRAFDSFKDWLTKIYQKVQDITYPTAKKGRKKPMINDDVRGVFDNLLGGRDQDIQYKSEADILSPKDLEISQYDAIGIETQKIWEDFQNENISSRSELAILEEAQAEIDQLRKDAELFQDLDDAVYSRLETVEERAKHLSNIRNLDYDNTLRALKEIEALATAEDTLSLEEYAVQRSKFKDEAIKAMELKARNTALTILAKRKMMTQIDDIVSKGHSPEDAVLSILEGRSEYRDVKGAGSSVYSTYNALDNYYLSEIENRLTKIDPLIFDALENNPKLNDDIIREMRSLDDDFTDSVTGNKRALEAAQELKLLIDEARERLNKSGSSVGYLKNWTPQNHDYEKMIKAGELEWINTTKNLIDIEKTFGNKADDPQIYSALKKMYYDLTTGRSLDEDITTEIDILEGRNKRATPANRSKKHDFARELHFIDADSQILYNEIFGDKNVVKNIYKYLNKSARTLSLVERLGPNPEFTISTLLEDIKDQVRGDTLGSFNTKQKRKIIESLPSLNEIIAGDKAIGKAMHEALGKTMISQNINASAVSQFIRNVQTASKLGSATLSQLPDSVNITTEIMNLKDVPAWQAWLETGKIYFKKQSDNQKEILKRMGLVTQGILTDSLDRWNAQDRVVGKSNKMINTMFRLNGMDFLTRKTKSGFALSLSSELGDNLSKSFNDLTPGLRESLAQFGNMDELKWDVLRKATTFVDGDTKYLTPDMVETIPDEAFDILLPKDREIKVSSDIDPKKIESIKKEARKNMIISKRNELEMDLRRFMIEEMGNAVLEPDARTARYVKQGTKPGTLTGEALRFMMQFKSFTFTQYHRVLKAQRWKASANDSAFKGLPHYAATMIGLGYMSLAAKDLAKGREPRKPHDYQTFVEAVAQSGGAGIFGDIIFNADNRFGGSAVATFLGPTVGAVDDAFDIKGNIQRSFKKGFDRGEMRTSDFDIGSNLVQAAKQNTPFQSLWWARAAFDYGVMFHLREAMNPGSLRRMERRMKRDSGQEYMISPSKFNRSMKRKIGI